MAGRPARIPLVAVGEVRAEAQARWEDVRNMRSLLRGAVEQGQHIQVLQTGVPICSDSQAKPAPKTDAGCDSKARGDGSEERKPARTTERPMEGRCNALQPDAARESALQGLGVDGPPAVLVHMPDVRRERREAGSSPHPGMGEVHRERVPLRPGQRHRTMPTMPQGHRPILQPAVTAPPARPRVRASVHD